MEKAYMSDKTIAEKNYKKSRSKYARFLFGIFLCILLTACFFYDVYNMYLWIDFGCDASNIIIHIGIALVIMGLFILCILYLLSGGKNGFLKNIEEKLILYNDHLELHYLYKKKMFRIVIYFCDVEELFFETDKRRLRIKSDCLILSSADETSMMEDPKQLEKDGGSTYIYAKYQEFEYILKQLQDLSLKKIISDSKLI